MKYGSPRLSVNLNKIALIRNSRGQNMPDLITVAKDCEAYGAQGITVHPRPDERHIRFDDLLPLKKAVATEFNVEGYPGRRFMEAMETVRPHQCTLVPDAPGALTSDAGWDIEQHRDMLEDSIGRLASWGVRSSLFLYPRPADVALAKSVGADRVEFYTGPYASRFVDHQEEAIAPHVEAAQEAERLGVGLNAGHDLSLDNLQYYQIHLPNLLEVSIGHALVCDALYYGLENVIPMYLRRLKR